MVDFFPSRRTGAISAGCRRWPILQETHWPAAIRRNQLKAVYNPMKSFFHSFEQRLYRSGLAKPGDALMGMADPAPVWNESDDACRALTPLFHKLHINALVFIRPAEPYAAIMDYLAATASQGVIRPEDCETRMFLHDIPVVERFSADALAEPLTRRKCAVIPGAGIVARGAVDIEQPYVAISAACFAGFVKFFSDMLHEARSGGLSARSRHAFELVAGHLQPPFVSTDRLAQGPFTTEAQIHSAMAEAGKKTVFLQLVDASFGNVSYFHDHLLYISQTGSFLDDLENAIVSCPADGTACAPVLASSELPAHMEIVRQTGCRAVLHGHPRFSVILSMDCDKFECPRRGQCYRDCPEKRTVNDIPVVSGEVGAGPYGLCHTVPAAVARSSAAIVHGHGVFTMDPIDFNGALDKLIDIETRCRIEYFNRLNKIV
jgi:ribulose-5-phosphate 4-epimerase/fuculose-1-phosphate aldolase